MCFQTGLWKELLFPNITCLPVPRGEAESWRCLGWWGLPKLLIVLINSTDGYYSALPGPVLPRPPRSAVLGPSHSPGILMGFMPHHAVLDVHSSLLFTAVQVCSPPHRTQVQFFFFPRASEENTSQPHYTCRIPQNKSIILRVRQLAHHGVLFFNKSKFLVKVSG